MLRGLWQAGADIEGVDCSEFFVHLGREQWPDMGSRLMICDAVNLHLYGDGAFDGLPNDVQDEIDDALNGTNPSQVDTAALQRCIENAIGPNGANQNQINRCLDRFGP